MCRDCQRTDHLWGQYLLLLILCGCSGPAVQHRPECLPLPASPPYPVLGFWESVRRGMGCASRGRSATGQEVHIISLRRELPANGEVTLMLDSDPKGIAPILVLNSQKPLRWMLQTHPGNWTFQVSPGSSVSGPGLIALAEKNFPETARSLLKWAQREYGGVTSLVEYNRVNTVFTHLGAERTAPATCKLSRGFATSMHFASERRLQPLKLCLNSDPPRDLEVHVIFSKGVMPRPTLACLTVELHAVQRSQRQGLLLILKSEEAAQWMVRAGHFTGQLHVLVWASSASTRHLYTLDELVCYAKLKASHKVSVSSTETDLPLTVTQQTAPRLAFRDPLQYAAEQKLPAFTSYTEAERVNRFLLFVGLKGAVPSSADAKVLGSVLRAPPWLATSQQDFEEAFTEPLQGPRQTVWEGDISTIHPSPAANLEGVLCLGQQKPVLEKQAPPRVVSPSPPSTQASPPEAAVGVQDLPFHLGNFLLSLEIYSSEDFIKLPGPCTVSANSLVFVEAYLATYDLSLSFIIQQCFISPSSDSSVASPYLLVQHGCAVADAHVTLSESERSAQGQPLPPGYQERQRLSFVFQPRSNDSIHFLHCRLALCIREFHGPTKPKGPIPKCRLKNEDCRGGEEVARGRFQRTITKPILVTVETPPGAATPGLETENFLENQPRKVLKDSIHLQKKKPSPASPVPGLEFPAVVGIAFSAFIIGFSLAGGIWFIHSQTSGAAVRKRSQAATERDPEETTVPKLQNISSTLTAPGPACDSLL